MEASEPSTISQHVQVIEKNYEILQRCTDVNAYVIDCLMAEDVLTPLQESRLRSEKVPLERIRLLFDSLKEIQDLSKYESFLAVMERENVAQEHVANLLRGINEGESAPMSETRYARLKLIRPDLTDVIKGLEVDLELQSILRRLKAISNTDLDEIRSQKVGYKKSSMLVGAVMRRSNKAYDLFKQALFESGQHVVASFLEEGIMVTTHVNTTRPELDDSLAHALNESIKQNRKILSSINGINLPLAVAQPGNSIEVLVFCRKVENMETFIEIFNSGDLEQMLSSILNELLLTIEPGNTEELQIKLSIDEKDEFTLEEITGIEDWIQDENQIRRTRLYSVGVVEPTIDEEKRESQNPFSRNYGFLMERMDSDFGLLDILCETGVLSDVEFSKITAGNNTTIRNRKLLYFILQKKPMPIELLKKAFRQSGQQHLVNYISSDGVYEISFDEDWPITEKELRILNANSKLLLENLNAREHLFLFYCDNIINRKQLEFISSKNMYTEKNEVFLDIMKKSSLSNYKKTIRCLQKTKQHHIAKLLEEEISGLDYEEILRSLTPEKAPSENDDSQKTAFADRTASECGLEKVDEENETESTPVKSMPLNQNPMAIGMTIFRNEIFVVHKGSSLVDIYNLLTCKRKCRRIVKDITDPKAIASCNTNNCIYVMNTSKCRSKLEILKLGSSITRLITRWEIPHRSCELSVWGVSVVISYTDASTAVINEYDSNGSMILEREFHNNLIHFWKVVKSGSERYVFIAEIRFSKMPELMLIDVRGNILKAIPIQIELALNTLPFYFPFTLRKYPIYLTSVNEGNVLLAVGGSLFLYSSNLENEQEFVCEDENTSNTELLKSESNGRLYVVDNAYLKMFLTKRSGDESDDSRIMLDKLILQKFKKKIRINKSAYNNRQTRKLEMYSRDRRPYIQALTM